FGADRIRHPAKETSAPTQTREAPSSPPSMRITITEDTRRALADEHARAYSRPPTSAEMQAAISKWVDEEVLYREGLMRSLDKDDPKIRHLVSQKMAFILEQGLVLPAPTDAELAQWFEAHREKWAQPALVDFTQVFVNGQDAKAEEQARAFLAQLEKGA